MILLQEILVLKLCNSLGVTKQLGNLYAKEVCITAVYTVCITAVYT